MDQARARIRQFLERQIAGRDLADDTDIFAQRYVSSLFALELVNFLERSFGFSLDDDDLVRENFRSIVALTALVARKTGR